MKTIFYLTILLLFFPLLVNSQEDPDEGDLDKVKNQKLRESNYMRVSSGGLIFLEKNEIFHRKYGHFHYKWHGDMKIQYKKSADSLKNIV